MKSLVGLLNKIEQTDTARSCVAWCFVLVPFFPMAIALQATFPIKAYSHVLVPSLAFSFHTRRRVFSGRTGYRKALLRTPFGATRILRFELSSIRRATITQSNKRRLDPPFKALVALEALQAENRLEQLTTYPRCQGGRRASLGSSALHVIQQGKRRTSGVWPSHIL